jgi:CRISPR-associated protein Csx14
MVATLGGQPQVVTFALDALLARGEPVEEVYVLHLSPRNGDASRSLAKLLQEFPNDTYAGRPCRFRRVTLADGTTPLTDIRNAADAEATLRCVRGLLVELKTQGCRLHLCISGGRRMIGMLVMSMAALLCDHQDALWHMHTPDAFRARADGGAVMHAGPADGVQMIQAPLVPWGAYFPALREMAIAPQVAIAQQLAALTAANEPACRLVYERLSEREREVLAAFAAGLTPQGVAERLHISLGTVNTHKTAILSECRTAWGLGESPRLSYHFLREKFVAFLHSIGRL